MALGTPDISRQRKPAAFVCLECRVSGATSFLNQRNEKFSPEIRLTLAENCD
jgi:hypothetical protein